MRRLALASPLLALAVVIASATAAAADPVSDGFSSAQSGIVSVITNNALPLIIAVVLVGLGIALLVKYVRKGVRAA